MERGFTEYKGNIFPTIEISLNKISDIDSDTVVVLADMSLWDCIEYTYFDSENENFDSDENYYLAHTIDDGVYFYCDYGFIEGVNDESEVIEYMKNN